MKKLLYLLLVTMTCAIQANNKTYNRNVIYLTSFASQDLKVTLYATAQGMYEGKIQKFPVVATKRLEPWLKTLINTADFSAEINGKSIPASKLFENLAEVDIQLNHIKIANQKLIVLNEHY